MSVNNAYSLLNETEGSDTSYRTIHVSYHIRLTPEMAWSDTLKETFGQETDTVEEPVVEEEKPAIVEEKPVAKKNKKVKKPQKKAEEEEDLDAILKEMGVEIREDTEEPKKGQTKTETTKKRAPKRNTSKAASIIANEAAQRRNTKKKGKK